MMPGIRGVALVVLTIAAMGSFRSGLAQGEAATVPPLKIYRHSVWSDVSPKGVDAHGTRQNLAPGGSMKLDELTITLVAADAGTEATAEAAATADKATMTLAVGDATETRTVEEGEAFNWGAYHVAVPAIYLKKGELGFGSTVIEAATIASLPERVASSTKANGAADRLRVKHVINKLTLHHSATRHEAGEDLATKLKNMQAWGESDRNWFDVPYHFFIDLDGSIYQARDYQYAGDTNTRYDPSGHFLINCYGDYEKAEPNEKQIDAIARLMAWGAMENHIEPIEIYGHRDLAQTSCPGKNLYKYIEDGSLKKLVEAKVKAGKPQIVWLDAKEDVEKGSEVVR